MTECDAFNLIDEFIKYSLNEQPSAGSIVDSALTITTTSCLHYGSSSSTSSNKPRDAFNAAPSDSSGRSSGCNADVFGTPVLSPQTLDEAATLMQTPLEQIFVNLNMSKALNETNLYLTPPPSSQSYRPMEIKPPEPEEEAAEQFNQKPKRPYSYYVATNFHPLDLTRMTEENEQQLQQQRLNDVSTPTMPRKTTADIVVTKRTRKSKVTKLEMANKRLSTSLGDIQNLNNEIKLKTSSRIADKDKSSSQRHLTRSDEVKYFIFISNHSIVRI